MFSSCIVADSIIKYVVYICVGSFTPPSDGIGGNDDDNTVVIVVAVLVPSGAVGGGIIIVVGIFVYRKKKKGTVTGEGKLSYVFCDNF